MEISDLLTVDRVLLGLRVRDKDHLLRTLAERAKALGAAVPAGLIVGALRRREALGSTGLGRGFALPHASIDGLPDYFGLFVRLAQPIEFDAIDREPVDLVFLLLAPVAAGSAHVSALAAISRALRDIDRLVILRSAPSSCQVMSILTARTGRSRQ